MSILSIKYNMQKLSLRTIFIFPYVILVITLAVAIGILSYRTGNKAVLTVSEHLLEETVSRIGQAVDRHVVGSVATLEAAFPNGMLAPTSIESDLNNIRTRFWIATSLHIDPNNYVYYGNIAGQGIGLYRHSYERGEIRIKYSPEEHRKLYQIEGIDGAMRFDSVEKKLFDPRNRPWFQAGQETSMDIWTSVYIDFGTSDLVATRARRVLGLNGEIQGVVATDMPLKAVNDFVSNLEISPNGIAFIIEPDGNIIASSDSPNVKNTDGGEKTRINGAESGNRLLTEIYHHMQPYLSTGDQELTLQTFFFKDSNGDQIHGAFELFEDGSGLRWINVVAMPSQDFMGGISDNVMRTVILGIIATIIVVIIGLWILNWVTTDLKLLSEAVNRVDSGNVEEPIDIRRRDEIGDLAKSFQAMQYRLQTDHLTGLPNRYAFEQCLNATIQRYNKVEKSMPFAVLFIDINNFKLVNDMFGHDAGDQALIEFALRLRTNIRQHDMVARYAGDEFVIILKTVHSKKDLALIKNNIEEALAAPLKSFDAKNLKLGGAIGEAFFPEDANNAKDLLIVADGKMYANKNSVKEQKQ